MSDAIITVSNLGKKYRLRHQGEKQRYTALRDVLANKAKALFQNWKSSRSNHGTVEDFWALKDVSFEIKRGEVVGIIGRNGAGKSTLLKILSRITESTTGRVHLKGRVASLLEVGTGFHPELTGRENIFLNGAILGMSRAEIRRKFDEIVAFSEVEKFLDTPVKHYSSGMYVRLAFAVAAHLEPEILIVDEVLAVGDAEFQKKCLGKMGDVSRSGRTVLFVSHQITAVTRLCQSALWLEGGKIHGFGRADIICSDYLANGSKTAGRREWTLKDRAPGNEWVRLERVEAGADGKMTDTIGINSPVDITLDYRVLRGGKVLIPNIHLSADDGTIIFIAHDWYSGWRTKAKLPGRYRTTFSIPGNFFSEGRVVVKVAITTYQPFEIHFVEADAIAFTIVEVSQGETSRGDYSGHLPGVVRPLIKSQTGLIDP
ncbi:MAG: ABC transporter ATP-binding protein [Verrucomicrobiota bacterium]|jgi:lipopolysaccharide transport system ATP-binding protein